MPPKQQPPWSCADQQPPEHSSSSQTPAVSADCDAVQSSLQPFSHIRELHSSLSAHASVAASISPAASSPHLLNQLPAIDNGAYGLSSNLSSSSSGSSSLDHPPEHSESSPPWPGFTCLESLNLSGCQLAHSRAAGSYDQLASSRSADTMALDSSDDGGLRLVALLVRSVVRAGCLKHLQLADMYAEPTGWLLGAHSLLSLNIAGKFVSCGSHCQWWPCDRLESVACITRRMQGPPWIVCPYRLSHSQLSAQDPQLSGRASPDRARKLPEHCSMFTICWLQECYCFPRQDTWTRHVTRDGQIYKPFASCICYKLHVARDCT